MTLIVLLGGLSGCGGDDVPSGVCLTVADCPSGNLCLNGMCVPPSQPGQDVEEPERDTITSPDVQGECVRDEDCDDGFICRDRRCRPGGDCSCDPADPCTETAPECQCTSWGDECTTDTDCDDEEECTTNTCWCGFCEVAVADLPGCCARHEDCDDGIPCSENRCEFLRCVTRFEPGCCATDADCDDRDPCTTDRCVDHACQNESVGAGCCGSDADCDDGDECTRNFCLQGQCANPRRDDDPRCGCISDLGCLDGNPCSVSVCEAGLCSYSTATPDPPGRQCCRRDIDCDDGDIATRNYCREFQCHSVPRLRCDEVEGDCASAYICFEAVCSPDGWCVENATRANCCESDDDCDDGDPCTRNTCLPSNRCQNRVELNPGCCTMDGQCNDGLACTRGYCCLSELCSSQFGPVRKNHCYQVVDPFSDDCCTIDTQCTDPLPCTLDVCWQGQCYNVLVEDTCCATAADCDDGNPCTEDTCDNGTCLNDWVPGCCNDAEDCDDGDVCTTNTCEDAICRTGFIEGCCRDAADCNDQDVCTQDRCVDNRCEHVRLNPCCTNDAFCTSGNPCLSGRCVGGDCVYDRIPGCCTTVADCDDGDPCTIDRCLSNRCHHTPSTAPECCELTTIWQNGGFEDWQEAAFEFEGWQVQNMSPTLGWQVVSGLRSQSPTHAMYYGNSASRIYAGGSPHQGVARTPQVQLPDREDIFATFWTYLDYGGQLGSTLFKVSAATDLGSTALWNGTSFGGSTKPEFRFVELDLSTFRNQRIRLEFEFQTSWTDTLNSGEGVYVDDVLFGAGCFERPVECQTAADCVDDDPCTVAECIDQRCSVITTNDHPTCCAPRAFTATFDDGTVQGFATGLLSGASPRYIWTASDFRAASPNYALYFGDPDRRCPANPGERCPAYGDDSTAGREWPGGTAELGPIDLTGVTRPILTFALWTDIEPVFDLDHLDIIVTTVATGRETVVWSTRTNGMLDTGGSFVPIVVDLSSFANTEVQIRFVFEDTGQNGFGFREGVYIDDVTVGRDCR
jgi:hypothetical protein